VPELSQQNANLYLVHEGIWIDVHLSKVDYTDEDRATFDEVLKSARFEQRAK